MRCSHITLASDSRMPLFRDEAALRAGIRALVRVVGDRLVLFCFVDDHVHIVILHDVNEGRRMRQRVRLALRRRVAVPDLTARVRPVSGRRHLERLVPYVLRQPSHHGIDGCEALFTGSCFQDLIGARSVVDLRIRDALPRFTLTTALESVGLLQAVEPAAPDLVRAAGAVRIASAAACALSVGPVLSDRTAPALRALTTTVHLARRVGIPPTEIGWAIDRSARSVRRLATHPPEDILVRATRIRLSLEERLARQIGVGSQRFCA